MLADQVLALGVRGRGYSFESQITTLDTYELHIGIHDRTTRYVALLKATDNRPRVTRNVEKITTAVAPAMLTGNRRR